MARSVTKIPAYQLKVTLRDVTPAVWRRVVVPGQWHLGRLHDILQRGMGWQDSHLHEFDAGGRRIGQPQQGGFGPPVEDERVVRLHEVLPATGATLTYWYDFGDDWMHDLVVEEFLAPASHPSCPAGEGACPPEDSGGPFGYQMMLEAVAQPEHPDHEQVVEWLGGPFDPAAFDPAATDKLLRSMR